MLPQPGGGRNPPRRWLAARGFVYCLLLFQWLRAALSLAKRMQYKVASVISGTSKRQVTMTRTSLRPIVLLLAASGVLLAQQTPVDPQSAPPSNGGWRRMSDPA